MALPKQVRQQIAEAKRIEGELRAEQESENPAPAPTEPVVEAQPAPAAEPRPDEPVAQAPAPVPVEAPPQAPPAPAPTATQYAELLQQYRSLQGIHRTLVRSNSDHQSQVQTLQATVQDLTAEVERMKQQPLPAAPVPGITDAEVEEFGPELISVIDRKTQLATAPLNAELARLSARNAELEQSLSGVTRNQAEVAQANFQSRLLQLVPDFNALNFDPRFLSWLSQTDPLDARKKTLQQRLDEAVQYGDAEAVANFFNTFKSLLPAAPVAPPKPDLSSQAQPVSRSGPDTLLTPPAKMWQPNEIQEFYAKVARGMYTSAEKARIEKEIFAAQRDNRIAA